MNRTTKAGKSRNNAQSNKQMKTNQEKGRNSPTKITTTLLLAFALFLVGCLVSASFLIEMESSRNGNESHTSVKNFQKIGEKPKFQSTLKNKSKKLNSNQVSLKGQRILVAITSFDFSQVPHLEEILDSYRDACEAGAFVDVVIYTTVPYPVIFIDLLNSRLQCMNPSGSFSIQVIVKSPRLRLHLVDCHRTLFYEKIDDYDLFVYTEDDIRVTPSTLATYLFETEKVKELVGAEKQSDYNIGIVRYEYNYPPDVIIDDKTRHATANVTRVYWEHLGRPIFPEVAVKLHRAKLKDHYITMNNHHQGMFIATSQLLKDWKVRPGCKFDVIRNRPGMKNNPWQHTEGTQRVWMSSNMLFGSRHCNVKQLLPTKSFSALTVLHLPNKNYRRVGKAGRLGGERKDRKKKNFGSKEVFEGPSPLLVTELEFHIALRESFPPETNEQLQYNGIVSMVFEIGENDQISSEYFNLIKDRVNKFDKYTSRGGILHESDMFSSVIHDHISDFYDSSSGKMKII